MGVVIDQVTAETGEERSGASTASGSSGAQDKAGEPDLDRIDYQLARRRQRLRRRWAD